MEKILARLGTSNSDPVFGCDPGTLFLLACKRDWIQPALANPNREDEDGHWLLEYCFQYSPQPAAVEHRIPFAPLVTSYPETP